MVSRLQMEEADETRRALVDRIRDAPGLTVADLARGLALSHSTATYHLRRLERSRLVVSLAKRGRLHWFLNGQATPHERAGIVSRRLPRAEQVLANVPRESPAPLGRIAEGLDMTKPGVIWHLKRLETLGLVVAEGPAGARLYRAVA